MKKRVLSALTALALCLSILPSVAAAADNETVITVENNQMIMANEGALQVFDPETYDIIQSVDLNSNTTLVLTGNAIDSNIIIAELPESVSVTLRDLNIHHTEFLHGRAPFAVWADGTINVSIEGDVTLSSQMPPFAVGGMGARPTVILTGAGNLSLEKEPYIDPEIGALEMVALDVDTNASLAIELEGDLTITAEGDNDGAFDIKNPITIRARNITIAEPVSTSSQVTFIPSGKLTVNGEDKTPAAMVENMRTGTITTVDNLQDAFVDENSGAVITLLRDVTLEGNDTIRTETEQPHTFTLDLNGKKIEALRSNAMQVYGDLIIQDSSTAKSGEIVSTSNGALQVFDKTLYLKGGTIRGGDYCMGISVNPDGTLYVSGDAVISGDTRGINSNDGSICLSGGTIISRGREFYGETPTPLFWYGKTMKDLLDTSQQEGGVYYAYFTPDGTPITDVLEVENSFPTEYLTITVKKCTHEGVSEYTSNRNGTHTVTCRACGYTGAAEKCGYIFEGNAATCPSCESSLTVTVSGTDGSGTDGLVYDGTPKEPAVSVTLDGALLTAGTDYTVAYENNTNAGTGTVTVTGVSFNGSCTQNFTIDPATLTAAGTGIAKGIYGDTLSQLTVEGLTARLNGTPVNGSWILSGDAIPNVGDSGTYTAAFIPASGAGNYKPLTAPVTLNIVKADYTGEKTAGASAKFGTTRTYDLTALLQDIDGATAGTPSTSGSIFAGTPTVSGKALSYTLNADATTGSTGTVTVPVTSTNYNDFDLTITVTVTDKDVPELTVSDITVTYSGGPVPASAIRGTATVDGTAVSGTWSFAGGQAVTNVADSGVKTVKFTPDNTGEYMEAECTVNVTINKATPSGAPRYTAISTGGKRLSDAGLTGGTFSVPGTVAWELADSTEVTANTSYQWTFTPTDTGNYNTLSGSVVLWRRSTGGGGGGSYTPSTGSNLPVSTTTQGSTSTTETTAVPTGTTQGGTGVAKVDTSMGQEIIKQAVENNSEAVVIAPKITGSVTKTEVSIPAATVGQIGNQTGASLTISTPVAGVTIPNGGLGSLSSAGGTVTVSAEMQGSAVELSVTANGRTVEQIPGGVTLTVPMADTTPGTVAVLVHPDGTRETVHKSVARDGSVTIPLDGSARLVIVDNSRQFSDVPATSWAADAVAFASSHELFNGTGGGMFSPDAPMSRGMLAVVLHNLESNPNQALTDVFADVDNGAWYAEGIAWAAANGIVGGYGNGQFGPNDNITREQLAVMLWRYAGSPAATSKKLNFSDTDEISSYALEAMRWAVENGIINGYGDGRLGPKGQATRAQVAQMLKNHLGGE